MKTAIKFNDGLNNQICNDGRSVQEKLIGLAISWTMRAWNDTPFLSSPQSYLKALFEVWSVYSKTARESEKKSHTGQFENGHL